MVCTGHHADKNIPDFPGLEKFKGKVTHSHDYKNFRGYEDKRVLIIGIGNSGGDVANELSRISKQVHFFSISLLALSARPILSSPNHMLRESY